jgi:hypothetical protein
VGERDTRGEVKGLVACGDKDGPLGLNRSSVKISLSKLDLESVEREGTGDRAVRGDSVARREAELSFKVRKALVRVVVVDAGDIQSDGGKPVLERSPEYDKAGLYWIC